MRHILLYISILFCFIAYGGTRQVDPTVSLLHQLDSVISKRDTYIKEKERQLKILHNKLQSVASDEERFAVSDRLYNEYLSFNTDSAYSMTLLQEKISQKMGDKNKLMNARLNRANLLCLTGLYHNTLSLIDSVPRKDLPDYLKPYYFHTKRTVYGNLAEAATFKPEKDYYLHLTDLYRDSLLKVNDPNSLFYILIKADQLNVHGKPKEALSMLEKYMKDHKLSDHDKAICAWTLSESYKGVGDKKNQKRQLLISAIADMKSAVREYVSLRQLALMLYEEGDLDRAYKFMTISIKDASECNARQRIVEISGSYPAINDIYIEKVRSQKLALERTIWIITFMAIILIVLLFFSRSQVKRVAKERKRVEEAYEKLNQLNCQLSDSNSKLNVLNEKLSDSNAQLNELNSRLIVSNKKLQEAYGDIAEISELKEVYICRYMDQSLAYIEMLDSFRKSVAKQLNSGKTDELLHIVKSSKTIDEEFKTFYDRFDKTFLNIFPSFIEDFNKLLLPDETILPKKPGSLTVELRIYALIRLGITHSDKIAKFLRYSLTTIYNYRTKVRNKARGDRSQLENEVMKIGR